MLDAYAKQRKAQPRGERHVNAKLSNRQAAAIRRTYRTGVSQDRLAAKYGVSQRVISLIVSNKTYV